VPGGLIEDYLIVDIFFGDTSTVLVTNVDHMGRHCYYLHVICRPDAKYGGWSDRGLLGEHVHSDAADDDRSHLPLRSRVSVFTRRQFIRHRNVRQSSAYVMSSSYSAP